MKAFIDRVVILEPCEMPSQLVFAGAVQSHRVCTGKLGAVLSSPMHLASSSASDSDHLTRRTPVPRREGVFLLFRHGPASAQPGSTGGHTFLVRVHALFFRRLTAPPPCAPDHGENELTPECVPASWTCFVPVGSHQAEEQRCSSGFCLSPLQGLPGRVATVIDHDNNNNNNNFNNNNNNSTEKPRSLESLSTTTKKCLSLLKRQHLSERDGTLQCSAGPKWDGYHGIDDTLASTWAPTVGRPSKSGGCLAARIKKPRNLTKKETIADRILNVVCTLQFLHSKIEIVCSV